MGEDGPKEGRMAELSDSKKNRIHLTDTDMEMLALSAQTPRKGRVRLAEPHGRVYGEPRRPVGRRGDVPDGAG